MKSYMKHKTDYSVLYGRLPRKQTYSHISSGRVHIHFPKYSSVLTKYCTRRQQSVIFHRADIRGCSRWFAIIIERFRLPHAMFRFNNSLVGKSCAFEYPLWKAVNAKKEKGGKHFFLSVCLRSCQPSQVKVSKFLRPHST